MATDGLVRRNLLRSIWANYRRSDRAVKISRTWGCHAASKVRLTARASRRHTVLTLERNTITWNQSAEAALTLLTQTTLPKQELPVRTGHWTASFSFFFNTQKSSFSTAYWADPSVITALQRVSELYGKLQREAGCCLSHWFRATSYYSAAPSQLSCQRQRRTDCHCNSHSRVLTLPSRHTHTAPVLTNTKTAKMDKYLNISDTQYIATWRQIKGIKEFKKSPGSAFLETSCITTSKNPSSKNQTSSILGIWARDRTTFSGPGRDLFFPHVAKTTYFPVVYSNPRCAQCFIQSI